MTAQSVHAIRAPSSESSQRRHPLRSGVTEPIEQLHALSLASVPAIKAFDNARWEPVVLLIGSVLLHLLLVSRVMNARLSDATAPVVPPAIPPMVHIALIDSTQSAMPLVAQPVPKPKPLTASKPATQKPKSTLKPKPKPPEEKRLEDKAEPQSAPVQTPSSATPHDTAVPVSEPRAFADYLHNPAPVYPEEALANGWQGRVLLKVEVLADGRPGTIDVAKSSGKAVLDKAALNAVRKWRFQPARRGSDPIVGWVTVPLDFKVQD